MFVFVVSSCFFYLKFFLKLIFFVFLNRFEVLMLKKNFKKNFILTYFQVKNNLKINRHHNIKHYLNKLRYMCVYNSL